MRVEGDIRPMSVPVYQRNALLRERLIELISAPGSPEVHPFEPDVGLVTSPSASQDPQAPVHAVVTINEINDMHGTGPLVKRIFKDRCGIFSIRSRDHWGTQDFGDWNVKISQEGRTRPESFRRVLRVLAGRNVKTVTCVPFLADELLTSIAIKESFGARMCGYIMDDQNVAQNVIPDALMREFLEKCSLRLATHPELRDAYVRKYGLPFYILPAVAPAALVPMEPLPPAYNAQAKRGALLGSFWDQSWFDQLCAALEPSHYRIDWYGQNRSPWLKFPPEDLARAGITPFGILPEERLAVELRQYPFVIVPCGALGGKETNVGVASLSLPGRILFAAATSHTPILLVGSERSCGARFVERFGIGVTVPYDAARLAEAMKRLSQPQLQAEMRRKAAAIAGALSDRGVVDWLSEAIERGEPPDSRFEDLFAGGCPARGYSRDSAARAAAPGK
jgi:hypothetical protein